MVTEVILFRFRQTFDEFGSFICAYIEDIVSDIIYDIIKGQNNMLEDMQNSGPFHTPFFKTNQSELHSPRETGHHAIVRPMTLQSRSTKRPSHLLSACFEPLDVSTAGKLDMLAMQYRTDVVLTPY